MLYYFPDIPEYCLSEALNQVCFFTAFKVVKLFCRLKYHQIHDQSFLQTFPATIAQFWLFYAINEKDISSINESTLHEAD
jgi:hypothetical protein